MINKYTLITIAMHDLIVNFGREYAEKFRPTFARMSDEGLAAECNMRVIRKGFFVSK